MYNEEGQVCLFDQDSCAGKTSQGSLAQGRRKARTSGSSSRKSAKLVAIPYLFLDLTPGHGNLLGEFRWELRSPLRSGLWTLNTGVSPRDARASSLSQILEDSPPRKYYLSRKACLGILRRSRERNKPLPRALNIALMAQAGLIRISGSVDVMIHAPDTATEEPSLPFMAFAANQRDEVRNLHDVAGALGAQPGMKQQTFVAGIVSKGSGDCFLSPDRHTALSSGGGQAGQGYPCVLTTGCLNPWDTQQARVFTPDSTAPTLAGADGGGGRNPGGVVFTAGFCAGAGPSAGSIGYQEEVAPTLKAAPSGNMMPSVLCLNDQGGQIMELTEDITGTIRAQEHGHQPLVFENHGVDARYTGPHEVVPTLSCRAGTGGNNLPLVGVELYERQRCDRFEPSETASTQSARQHKDAADLIYQETVGALTTSDSKGPNAQYVSQDKLIVEAPLLIRRLTPRECERLMGLPDDWTALPGAADSPRYRALGNSVVIQCVEYIMQGIACALRAQKRNAG